MLVKCSTFALDCFSSKLGVCTHSIYIVITDGISLVNHQLKLLLLCRAFQNVDKLILVKFAHIYNIIIKYTLCVSQLQNQPNQRENCKKVSLPGTFPTPKGSLFSPSNLLSDTLRPSEVPKKGYLCITLGSFIYLSGYFYVRHILYSIILID
jgi:hypothetical protein